MQLHLSMLVFAAPVLSAAFKQTYLSTCSDSAIKPAWEVENDLTIVPLNKTARTGLVDPVLEEGLIYSLGSRFANEFYANISSDGDLGSCWSCIPTIFKESPCIYQAIKDRKFSDLLNCGLDKEDICKCVDCLPKILKQFVEPFCEGKVNTEATKEVISPVDFVGVSKYDIAIQGYRGDLKTYHLSQVKNLACDFGIGTSCGDCDCCVGVCAHIPFDGDHCLGGCA